MLITDSGALAAEQGGPLPRAEAFRFLEVCLCGRSGGVGAAAAPSTREAEEVVKELDFYQLPPAATHLKNLLHVRTLQALQSTLDTITAHMQARNPPPANSPHPVPM